MENSCALEVDTSPGLPLGSTVIRSTTGNDCDDCGIHYEGI